MANNDKVTVSLSDLKALITEAVNSAFSARDAAKKAARDAEGSGTPGRKPSIWTGRGHASFSKLSTDLRFTFSATGAVPKLPIGVTRESYTEVYLPLWCSGDTGSKVKNVLKDISTWNIEEVAFGDTIRRVAHLHSVEMPIKMICKIGKIDEAQFRAENPDLVVLDSDDSAD